MKNNIHISETSRLKNVIRSIWQIDELASHRNETIIPKGIVEIIFDLGENAPIQFAINEGQFKLPKCFINGFNTSPILLQLPERHFFFGVQFHPMAIKQIFKVPAREFSNFPVDLTLIDPSFNSLGQQLADVKTFKERVFVISQWAENKIIQAFPQELLVNDFLESGPLIASIKQLAQITCYSPRHLSRKIHELTGMNTEQYLLYKKYLHALNLIHHTDLTLTEIAYESNFADQSHFTKSFRAFTHITPKEYRQTKGHIAGHMLRNVR